MNVSLSRDEIAFFRTEGYLRLPRLTTEEDVAVVRDVYDRLFHERAGWEDGNQFDLSGAGEDATEARLPQILEPARYAPELNDSLMLQHANSICKQLLGDAAECTVAHAILKPAMHGSETPWHQDAAYWDPNVIARSISIWVPLQPATIENGCMQFVPGSHRLDVLPHRSIGDDPRVHGLELDPSAMHHVERAVPCPLPTGGCTIHGGYMLHYAGPNRTEEPRRALILAAWVDGPRRKTPVRFPWQEKWNTSSGEKRRAQNRQD
jgi:hypothetical protein